MNITVTSREAILKVCRTIVSEQGLPALSMRSVAARCHVALGSLYNYFPSKDDLVIATIESVWQDIFHRDQPCKSDLSFPDYVRWIFQSVRDSTIRYPNFFTAHALGFASAGKNKAKDTMERYFAHMRLGMEEAIRNDASIEKDMFSESFSESAFVDFILTNIMMLLLRKAENCDILVTVVRRSLAGGRKE